MERSVITLIRVLVALMLGLAGLLALLSGVYLSLERSFALFGGPGAVVLVFVLIGLGLLYGSWRLFKTTLSSPTPDL